MSYTVLPPPTFDDWLRGWKEWARTRKRGKMAQFIVDKLEDGVRYTYPVTCISGMGEIYLPSHVY